MSSETEENKNVELTKEELEKLTPEQLQKIKEAQEAEQAAVLDLGTLPGDYFLNARTNFFEYNNVIWIADVIDRMQGLGVIQKLLFLAAQIEDKTKPIKIFVSSPGGECNAGFAIIDCMEEVKKRGITIETVAIGDCCSMASVILSAGSKGHRYVYPSTRIMIHESGVMETGGKFSDMRTVTKELQISTDLMAKIYAKATGKTVDECREAMNHDNYMSANEAKKFGLVDKIKVPLVLMGPNG